MNSPNFQSMNRQELQKYVLEHRENREAFHAFIDKLHAEGNWIEMPPMQSDEDFENYPEFIATMSSGSKSSARIAPESPLG